VTHTVVPSTFLFCPGNRPDRFDKALRSGAPGIILDLEDAVPAEEREAARHAVLDWLAGLSMRRPGTPAIGLRISPPQSESGFEDLYALRVAGMLPALDWIAVPKAEEAAQVRSAHAHLARRNPDVRVMALVESVRGVRCAEEIAMAGPFVAALAFGAADFCAETGIDGSWEALAYVRGRLIFEAAAAGVPVLDVPHLLIDDDAGLRLDCKRARAMGFHGKLAIHPRQCPIIMEAFLPNPQQVEWARRVVAGYEAARGRACVVDAVMVDEPVYRRACRILQRAAA